MPIYEYMCRGCGTRNEFLEGATQVTEDRVCEDCGSTDLHKLISMASFTVASNSAAACGTEDCALERGGSPGACGCAGACGHL